MIGLLKGMAITIRHGFSHSPNERWPYRPKVLPERARSSFSFGLDEDGTPLCKSCMLCEKNCPNGAISIESHKNEDGPGRVLDRFQIDLGLCMYCGICVENCASGAVRHSGFFEGATHERTETVLVLYASTPAAADGGEDARR